MLLKKSIIVIWNIGLVYLKNITIFKEHSTLVYWVFFLVDFEVPWRTKRSWRRSHRTRTTLRSKNLWRRLQDLVGFHKGGGYWLLFSPYEWVKVAKWKRLKEQQEKREGYGGMIFLKGFPFNFDFSRSSIVLPALLQPVALFLESFCCSVSKDIGYHDFEFQLKWKFSTSPMPLGKWL